MSNLETGWLNAFLSHIKKKKKKTEKTILSIYRWQIIPWHLLTNIFKESLNLSVLNLAWCHQFTIVGIYSSHDAITRPEKVSSTLVYGFLMLTYTFPFFFNVAATEPGDRTASEFLHVSKVFLVLTISIPFKLQAGNLARINMLGFRV